MRTIIEVTLKINKEEMFTIFEDFIQHGKCKVKAEGGPMINFVKEGNGAEEEKRNPIDATKDALNNLYVGKTILDAAFGCD
jgi:hypothetical protein